MEVLQQINKVATFTDNLEGDNHEVLVSTDADFMMGIAHGIYQDKTLAIVRELICNGRDGQGMKGNLDTPLRIEISSSSFKVRDFGTGIDNDVLPKIYMTFGGSTKRNQDNQTGGFGVGTKVPWAICNEFTIRNFKDGKVTTYVAMKSDPEFGGKPNCKRILSVPTTEPDGVEVTVPISVKQSEEFIYMARMYAWMLNIPAKIHVMRTGEDPTTYDQNSSTQILNRFNYKSLQQNGFATADNVDISTLKSVWAGMYGIPKVSIRLGDALYPVSRDDAYASHYDTLVTLMGNSCICLKGIPGEIAPTMSRETLSLTDDVIKGIKKAINVALQYYATRVDIYTKAVIDRLEQKPSLDRVIYLFHSKYSTLEAEAFKLANNSFEIAKSIQFDLADTSDDVLYSCKILKDNLDRVYNGLLNRLETDVTVTTKLTNQVRTAVSQYSEALLEYNKESVIFTDSLFSLASTRKSSAYRNEVNKDSSYSWSVLINFRAFCWLDPIIAPFGGTLLVNPGRNEYSSFNIGKFLSYGSVKQLPPIGNTHLMGEYMSNVRKIISAVNGSSGYGTYLGSLVKAVIVTNSPQKIYERLVEYLSKDEEFTRKVYHDTIVAGNDHGAMRIDHELSTIVSSVASKLIRDVNIIRFPGSSSRTKLSAGVQAIQDFWDTIPDNQLRLIDLTHYSQDEEFERQERLAEQQTRASMPFTNFFALNSGNFSKDSYLFKRFYYGNDNGLDVSYEMSINNPERMNSKGKYVVVVDRGLTVNSTLLCHQSNMIWLLKHFGEDIIAVSSISELRRATKAGYQLLDVALVERWKKFRKQIKNMFVRQVYSRVTVMPYNTNFYYRDGRPIRKVHKFYKNVPTYGLSSKDLSEYERFLKSAKSSYFPNLAKEVLPYQEALKATEFTPDIVYLNLMENDFLDSSAVRKAFCNPMHPRHEYANQVIEHYRKVVTK